MRISKLIIFGDSLSDIGNKRVTGTGIFARATGLAQINEVGRFSDGKNWTDYLWEWAGGDSMFERDARTTQANSLKHRSLRRDSHEGSPRNEQFFYANYAEGGAMGASDVSGLGLGTFAEQQRRYLKHFYSLPLPSLPSLYLVWFGLNDLVTNSRPAATMGTVAEEMSELCQEILARDSQAYFIFANLPNPRTSIRFAGRGDSRLVRDLELGTAVFGEALSRHVERFPAGRSSIVDLGFVVDDITANVETYGLTSREQPRPMTVRYRSGAALSSLDLCTTTADRAHPTEAVHRVFARAWADHVLQQFDLGHLADNDHLMVDVLGRRLERARGG